ncbi:MAG: TIGR02453 family protein [Pseudomonadota bacterium]
MAGHGFTEKSFEFFEELTENNNKEWFQAHKPDFKTYVEDPFLDLLEALTDRLSDAEVPLRGNPKTKFRMNRDLRFSEDKSPYKTSIAALLTPSGTKQEGGGVLYFHMDANGGFTGTGWHMLPPKALKPFRRAMVDQAETFDKVRKALSDSGRGFADDNSLKSMPRGFEDFDDHRHADAIKLKSLLVSEPLPKIAFTSSDVVDRVEKMARDAMPFLVWGREVSA